MSTPQKPRQANAYLTSSGPTKASAYHLEQPALKLEEFTDESPSDFQQLLDRQEDPLESLVRSYSSINLNIRNASELKGAAIPFSLFKLESHHSSETTERLIQIA